LASYDAPLTKHSFLRGRFEISSGVQLIEQRLGVLQIKRVKALSKPAINRSEQSASLTRLALIAPQPRHAHRRAQFPGLRLLSTRDRKGALEIRLRV
jgi:hypothetical protein